MMLQILVTVLMQTEEGFLDRIPLWSIVLVLFLVVVFAVIWTLHEESQEDEEEDVLMPETAVAPIAETQERIQPVLETAVAVPESAPIQPDDLKKIEGIGPKIASLLQAKGIATFAQLAAAEVAHLREIMLEANLRIANPDTWPEQAALAAAGNWDALATLQDNLQGGRREE